MELNKLLIISLGLLALSGCATTTPTLDDHFGIAVNAAKAQQTLNPDASRNPDPVAGIDGTPAVDAVGEYYNSFKAPAPTFPVLNIGTGGGGR